jgi:hypothetical protein
MSEVVILTDAQCRIEAKKLIDACYRAAPEWPFTIEADVWTQIDLEAAAGMAMTPGFTRKPHPPEDLCVIHLGEESFRGTPEKALADALEYIRSESEA